MVLAAGLGTRLRPLTESLPKPLVPIGDRSVLAHIAERLHQAGVTRLVANTHHRAEAFHGAALEGFPLSCELVHEPAILGTAGGVANARAALGQGDILVWNGDILADLDLVELVRRHRESGAVATLAACSEPRAHGTLGLGPDGQLVRLRNERYGPESRAVDFVGIQVISPWLRERLPAAGCLVADAYQPALRAQMLVEVAEIVRSWRDVGSLSAYLRANVAWLADLGRGSWVGPEARIEPEVALSECVVGQGAQVSGRGELRRVVVWPHARVQAPLADAVVTGAGQVVSVVESAP